MRKLSEIASDYEDKLQGLDEWIEDTYNKKFVKYFEHQRKLKDRMIDADHPITDSELETILIDIPLQLFSISEVLNSFKLRQEAIRLSIKEKKYSLAENSTESSETKRKEYAAQNVIEDEFLLNAYDAVIARVEKEMSYSRELIMGAKKIWDGRKGDINPVSENTSSSDEDNLPDYQSPTTGKSYIRGGAFAC